MLREKGRVIHRSLHVFLVTRECRKVTSEDDVQLREAMEIRVSLRINMN